VAYHELELGFWDASPFGESARDPKALYLTAGHLDVKLVVTLMLM